MKAWKYRLPNEQGYVFARTRGAATRIVYENGFPDWSEIKITRAEKLDGAWGDKLIQFGKLYSGSQVRKALTRRMAQGGE